MRPENMAAKRGKESDGVIRHSGEAFARFLVIDCFLRLSARAEARGYLNRDTSYNKLSIKHLWLILNFAVM